MSVPAGAGQEQTMYGCARLRVAVQTQEIIGYVRFVGAASEVSPGVTFVPSYLADPHFFAPLLLSQHLTIIYQPMFSALEIVCRQIADSSHIANG